MNTFNLVASVLGIVAPALAGGPSTGLVPLTQLPPANYMGFPGGLYPGESNVPPAVHAAAALAQAALIVPRDAAGAPAAEGKIVMLAFGMSNTTHEFSVFERQEDANPARNGRVVILNTAFGGQTASVLANPGAAYWTGVFQKIAAAGATNAQVQVAWLKEANANPTDPFPLHAQALRDDLASIARNVRDFFPNLRILYVSSRIYGGYSSGPLNPEPFAYESGFSVKWLIENQIAGDPALNWNPAAGPVEAPLLLWGPYTWADGVNLRDDGLAYLAADFEGDGVHPSPSGEQKVADQLTAFINSDPGAASWYPAPTGVGLRALNAAADATVDSNAPSTNFGAAPQLTTSGGAQVRRAYLKFDLTAVPRPVAYAKLSLRVATTGAGGGNLNLVNDSSWAEGSITFGTAPAPGAAIVAVPQSSRDGEIDADVTAAVNADADGIVSFVLSSPASQTAVYVSREGGQPPRLILTLRTPACPGDADGDGAVGLSDIALIISNWFLVGSPGTLGDLTGDGVRDLADLALVINHWGAACP